MLMTDQQAAELAEPGVGPLHDPSPLVAAEFAPIVVSPFLVVAPVRCNQFNAALLQPLAQRIGIVAAVGNHALGLLPRAALAAWDADFRERGFRKRNFCRRGTFQPNSQRNTFTVCQYHPLRSLAALGFTDRSAPFFAGAKLPSRKVSSHSSSWWWFSAASSCCQASTQTPSSSHCRSRRQQVEPLGYNDGRSRQRAPVLSTHRMPSTQAVRRPGPSSTVSSSLRLREEMLDQLPLPIGEPHAASFAACGLST